MIFAKYICMEMWKPVKNFENTHEVSNLGIVRSKRKILCYQIHKQGYPYVELWNGKRKVKGYIHRLIAQVFIPNLENLPCVCHKDDDASNFDISNLFWATHNDNMQDMIKKGRANKYSREIFCVQTGEIFKSAKYAAIVHGVSTSTIRQSCLTSWKGAGYNWEFIN